MRIKQANDLARFTWKWLNYR